MSNYQERRFVDVILGVLSGVFGTIAFDNLVNMLVDTGMERFRFVLFILFAGSAVFCFIKGLRKF